MKNTKIIICLFSVVLLLLQGCVIRKNNHSIISNQPQEITDVQYNQTKDEEDESTCILDPIEEIDSSTNTLDIDVDNTAIYVMFKRAGNIICFATFVTDESCASIAKQYNFNPGIPSSSFEVSELDSLDPVSSRPVSTHIYEYLLDGIREGEKNVAIDKNGTTLQDRVYHEDNTDPSPYSIELGFVSSDGKTIARKSLTSINEYFLNYKLAETFPEFFISNLFIDSTFIVAPGSITAGSLIIESRDDKESEADQIRPVNEDWCAYNLDSLDNNCYLIMDKTDSGIHLQIVKTEGELTEETFNAGMAAKVYRDAFVKDDSQLIQEFFEAKLLAGSQEKVLDVSQNLSDPINKKIIQILTVLGFDDYLDANIDPIKAFF